MQNIEYKPDWEAVHDFHHDERSRLENEIKDLIKTITPESGNSKLKKLQKERDYHHETCLRCLDTYQHKTVQHYVRWALKNSGTLSDTLKQNYAAHISFDHCQTIEQARAIIGQLHELESKDEFLNRNSGGKPCPAGKPDGLDIFSRTDANNLTTQWMNYAAQHLIQKIQKGKLGNDFTLNDVRRKGWSGLTKKDAVQEALDWMEDTHWVRGYDTSATPSGGCATRRYKINPKAAKHVTCPL